MNGLLAATGNLSFELVVVIVAVSMIAGAVDLLRQPGWAWKRAEESKPAYFVLVLLVPLVGLGMYVHIARPKVKAIAAAGRAASLPFERFGDDAVRAQREDDWPIGTHRRTRAVRRASGPPRSPTARSDWSRPSAGDRARGRPGDGSFGAGGGRTTATATGRPDPDLPSHPADQPAGPEPPVRWPHAGRRPVPAGWKADPTGRHQFRYWAGSQWTENVADDGEQSRDAVTS